MKWYCELFWLSKYQNIDIEFVQWRMMSTNNSKKKNKQKWLFEQEKKRSRKKNTHQIDRKIKKREFPSQVRVTA